MIRLHLILLYVVSYLHILSHSSLDLCLVLCTLPPLMSYSLALSSTMMSCTVHSPTDSLAQPSCIVVYIACNPAPRGSTFKLSLGLHSNSQILSLPFLLRVSRVVVCPRFALGHLTRAPAKSSFPYHLWCFLDCDESSIHFLCQDRFSTDLSSGIWGSGFGLALRPECCVVRIVLPEGWEGQPSA